MAAKQTQYVFETPQAINLRNTFVEISISRTSGLIRSMTIRNHSVLRGPCSVEFGEELRTADKKVLLNTIRDEYPEFATVTFTTKYGDLIVQYQYTIDTLALRWDVTVTNAADVVKEGRVDFMLPVSDSLEQYFHCGLTEPRTFDVATDIFLTYRRHCYIPMIAGFSTKGDYGLSVIAPLEIRKPELTFAIANANFTISYCHLLLPAKKDIAVGLYIVPHAGCWRPGLHFLLDRYSEYFYPATEKTKSGEGWFYLSYPSVNTSKVKMLARRGVTWIELHEYFPFYGLYAPEQQTWGIILDSDEVSLSNWEKGCGQRKNSYGNMATLINLFHTYGIQVYLYMQSAEAWQQFSRKHFPQDIARDATGTPLPSWKFTNLMNPDPNCLWGNHIIAQAKSVTEKYPQIDGIFYDRMDYWNYDFAHADGVTMVDSKAVYMLGFAQEQINEEVFKNWHQCGKGIWGNGPTSAEVCKNLDGIMAERSPVTLQKLQYLCLTRPLIYLAYDGEPRETEEKLKTALLHGAFPSISYNDGVSRTLEEKYRPLFRFMKNRQWVLAPHPVSFPYHLQGNVYQTPRGDYIITVVNPQKSQLLNHPFEYNVTVALTAPNQKDIKYSYQFSADWSGANALDFRKEGETLYVNIPVHRSSSIVILTKDPLPELVRVSSPILVRGRKQTIAFRGNNLRRTEVTIHTPWFTESTTMSDSVTFTADIPAEAQGEVEITIALNDTTYEFTNHVVDPVSIAPFEDIFIHSREGDSVLFELVNNTREKISLNLEGTFTKGGGRVEIPSTVSLESLGSKTINLFIQSHTTGILRIAGYTENDSSTAEFPISTVTHFDADDLFHDDFTEGMKRWHIVTGEWTVSQNIAQGSGHAHLAYIQATNWQDYSYEATLRCVGSSDPHIDWLKVYIFFRLQDEKNYYRFGIHGDAGVIDLYKCIEGTWTKLAASPFTPAENRWYTLRIDAYGAEIDGYIDNKKIIEANDSSLPSGGIGIGVLEDAFICDYRNIVVEELYK
jgi:hypothetical protein